MKILAFNNATQRLDATIKIRINSIQTNYVSSLFLVIPVHVWCLGNGLKNAGCSIIE